MLEALELESDILNEQEKRRIANLLTNIALEVKETNEKGFSDAYAELTIKHEQTRTQFIGLINFIEKNTKMLTDNMKTNTYMKVDFDPMKKKNVMKPRTSIVADMVKYLNSLNDLVIKFYEDVYEVHKMDTKEIQKEKIQISLF